MAKKTKTKKTANVERLDPMLTTTVAGMPPLDDFLLNDFEDDLDAGLRMFVHDHPEFRQAFFTDLSWYDEDADSPRSFVDYMRDEIFSIRCRIETHIDDLRRFAEIS